jgi:hypothetical protein
MELLHGTAKGRFINQRLGSFARGERISGEASLMRHLADVGLVELDAIKKPQLKDDGAEVPLSVLLAEEVLPTKTVEKPKKRVYKKKQK